MGGFDPTGMGADDDDDDEDLEAELHQLMMGDNPQPRRPGLFFYFFYINLYKYI